MQMSFAAGFSLAAAINLVVGPIGWRYVFAAGATPALITLFVRLFVREPRRWIAVRNQRLSAGSTDSLLTGFLGLFAPDIRRRTMVGLLVSASMMIGAFGGATLLPVWIRGLVGADPRLAVEATSQFFVLTNVGGVVGYLAVMWLSDAIGRRWSYFLMAIGCMAANLLMFTQIATMACCCSHQSTAFSSSVDSALLPSIFPNCFRRAIGPPARAFVGMRHASSPRSDLLRPEPSSTLLARRLPQGQP
jgi:MFS family permease